MTKKILIVGFDTPYPDNYGGVVDVVRKFQFFKKKGYTLDVVCTSFDANRTSFFEEFLKSNNSLIEHYYIQPIQPKNQLVKLFSRIPFSVKIRSIDFNRIDFLKNTRYDLVLVEHLKSTQNIGSLKKFLAPQKSPFWLRLHNDEAVYYRNLMKVEPNFLKKTFFWLESQKYKSYQSLLLTKNDFDGFLYISEADKARLSPSDLPHHLVLPIYQETLATRTTDKQFEYDFLYVGNLDSNDNWDALKRMLNFLKNKSLESAKIAIVGRCTDKNREENLQTLFQDFENLSLFLNATNEELKEFYAKSKFFLNFSSNSGGIKTKLIDAVNHLIPVISDENGVVNSGFELVVLHANKLDAQCLNQLLQNQTLYLQYHQKYSAMVLEKVAETKKMYEFWYSEFANKM
ncbi:glycosyltransferase [Vaginella massiliensis]|uniref:glycosyltransferase n=1 Tax=Vaginella massiliensis TaxID=1816680 RepID=UPI00083857D9|nr:glycosyltransferase [Vaginella massiliensis]